LTGRLNSTIIGEIMKIFLTGGTGFIGSYVAKAFLDNGHALTILARNTGKVPALAKQSGVGMVSGTLTDFRLIRENLKDKDAVVHVALGWGDSAVEMLKNDSLPSVTLMEEAAKAHVKHFLYTSSTAVNGNIQTDVDEATGTKPVDFYGATKAAVENYLFALAAVYPMRDIVIRPGFTFGNPVVEGASIQPDQRFQDIVRKALANEDIQVTKFDGTQFIHAADLAKIYVAALDSDVNREVYFGLGEVFVSWEGIAREAVAMAGSSSRILVVDKGYDEIPKYCLVNKIKKEFGLAFDAREQITKHLEYLCGVLKAPA
jgi:UDP-glucose 4-epimerase